MWYGPETMAEDERFIAKNFRARGGLGVLLLVGLMAVAYFRNAQEAVVVGIGLILYLLSYLESRLYDLCIRLRRTNILLSERDRA